VNEPTESNDAFAFDVQSYLDAHPEANAEIHEDAVFSKLTSDLCDIQESLGLSVDELAKRARVPVELLLNLEDLTPDKMTVRQMISLALELEAVISIKKRKSRVRTPKTPK
jgi:hypothetical protein